MALPTFEGTCVGSTWWCGGHGVGRGGPRDRAQQAGTLSHPHSVAAPKRGCSGGCGPPRCALPTSQLEICTTWPLVDKGHQLWPGRDKDGLLWTLVTSGGVALGQG